MYEVANGSIVVAGKVLNAQLPVIQTGIEPIAAKIIEYAEPIRVNTNVQSMTIVSEITYCVFMVVLLHIFCVLLWEKLALEVFGNIGI